MKIPISLNELNPDTIFEKEKENHSNIIYDAIKKQIDENYTTNAESRAYLDGKDEYQSLADSIVIEDN